MFSVRRLGARKQWALVLSVALGLSGVAGPVMLPPLHAQTGAAGQPVGAGFVVDAGDVRFIYQQILVAQAHAAGGTLLGPGPNQVADPQLPRGLRTVDGSMNNLVPVPDQHLFGSADRLFPRLLTPAFPDAEQGTSYKQVLKDNVVIDSQPRIITNLVSDQSAANPAAVAAAANPCGSGGFVCSGSTAPDPDSGALFIPNITPDFGLSAPFNTMFVFFGQFFDHGLDLVTKGGGSVIMPLQPDDPLFVPGSQTNFMVMTRGQNQPGPDGILGTADDIRETMNTTTPWVDQNQTYTSHPSHQVFLRQYQMVSGRPVPDGKMLDGGFCAPRGTGIAGDDICDVGNWAEVKAQARTKLGIQLTDQDVFDAPLILTDQYGHFKPGSLGFPQLVLSGNGLLQGDPTANGGAGVAIPATALRTGHAFLNDIAHNAEPGPGKTGVRDGVYCDFRDPSCTTAAGTYDGDVLDAHFITGDGRGNENIALSMVHQIFHAEHNRLVHYIDNVINTQLTPAEVTAWHTADPGSGWGYTERLFQAARFVTEMEYQHLVFEEYARTIQPLINPFLGGITSIDGAISAEFAHTVYRLGHSMLPERIDRIQADGTNIGVRLLTGFLNPRLYNANGTLSASQAAGSIIRGVSGQVGNELDEFVTSSVRNTLVGLPLDLPAINIARGRSEGIPSLNVARRQFFNATQDSAVKPYANWFEFGLVLRHIDSLVNFVAAYGTDPTITSATTVAAKRAAAQLIVGPQANGTLHPLMTAPAASSGLDQVDFWPGGMAEKPAVFGGLLGTTFNFVFEHQLEHLQDGDRFYYLQRTDGINLRFSLEGNSFAELARRNTDVGGTMSIIFQTADFNFSPTSTLGVLNAENAQLLQLADGTMVFFDPLHTGKNIVFNGGPGNDRFRADIGDDTLWGNDGNDWFDGDEGNDTLVGGAGDDILLGGNGDDVLKGGPGNDAMNTGPGFGADIAMGGEGNDFMVGGDDGVEYFGGPGNDIIVDGAMRSEGMFGGTGDDWIYDGDGHDGGLFGDGGNVFDLLAGIGAVGGDDVEGGGPGQDNHFGEGGDDIFLMSEGSNKFFGDYGFDWITQRGWPAPADIQMDLLAIPNALVNFNDLRNFYRFVDGASGWDMDDHIKGDSNTADPAAIPLAPELVLQPQMALTVQGAAKITGLPQLIAAFGVTAPNPAVNIPFFENAGGGSTLVKTEQLLWTGGNILLGGKGSDTITGGGGKDLIDGDRWLNVQLEATLRDPVTHAVTQVKLVDNPKDLIPDVFADPQLLNPGDIRIVRSIVTPPAIPADCATTKLNCDTAVFDGPQADFIVTKTAATSTTPERITVFHAAGVGKFGQNLGVAKNDETDTLLNIEQLQFTDGIVATSSIGATAAAGPGATLAATVTGTSAAPAASLTTAAVNIGANTLVVALVSADGTAARPTTVTAVTNSARRGAPVLTFTRASGTNAQPGDAEIWWAFSPTAIASTTISARLSRANIGAITVLTFTGASPLLTGAAGATNGTTGTPTGSLSNLAASSLVVAAGSKGGASVMTASGANQVIVNQFAPAGGPTFWSQRTTQPAAGGATVTVTSTPSVAAGAWNLALLEIRKQ